MAPRQGTESKQDILRRKLVNTEMHPIVDAIMTLVLLCMTPIIYGFAMIHDWLMFRFLNKTYIYNVSWEVRNTRMHIQQLSRSPHMYPLDTRTPNKI